MNVVLAQLPHPSVPARNLPLAAGFLKAFAHRAGLLDEVDVDILDGNSSGCARLVDQILSGRPDVLGFSLYLWNVARTLWVIEQVKRERPRIKILVGGPEVTPGAAYILSRPEIDFAVVGEGELAFAELLQYLLRGQPALDHISGLSYRRNGTWVHETRHRRLADLDLIPSPYLLGFIDPRKYREMMLFTMRGCTLGCSYCSWASRGPLRAFALERLRGELELAARTGDEMVVSVVDSALNSSPVFREFCRMAAEVNVAGRLKLNCFLQADRIDVETAGLLKAAGFSGVEIGLQSARPSITSRVNRRTDLEKFLCGVRLLREGGLPAIVDVILGLPGDTAGGFDETMAFVAAQNLQPLIFNLSLGHGAKLRREIASFGGKLQSDPPFYVVETDDLPRPELEARLRRFQRFSADRDPLISLNYPRFGMRRPVSGDFVPVGQTDGTFRLSHPVSDLVLSLHGTRVADGWDRRLPALLARSLGLNLRIICRASAEDLLNCDWLFHGLLPEICRENPHITLDLHLETDAPPGPALMQLARSSLRRRWTFLDYRDELLPPDLGVRRRSVNLFLHLPYYESVGLDVGPDAQVIAVAVIDPGAEVKAQVDEFLKAEATGLLIDFLPGSREDVVRSSMARLLESGRAVFFKDWVAQRLWEREFLRVTPEVENHCEVYLDSESGLATRVFAEKDLLWEAVSKWEMRRPEYAGDDLESVIGRLVADRIADAAHRVGADN